MDFRVKRGRSVAKPIPRNTPCGYCFKRWARCWDHIIPWSAGGLSDQDNLMPSCRGCNGLLSDKVFTSIEEKREYVRIRRDKGYRTSEEKGEVARKILRNLSNLLHAKKDMAKVLFNVMSVAELGPIASEIKSPHLGRKKKYFWGVDRLGVFSIEL